jgi:putative endonuclease
MTESARDASAAATAGEEPRLLVFELAGSPEAAAAARHALRAGNGSLPAAIRDDVFLLVTELVTNAFRHAHAGRERAIRVEFRCWPQLVRVSVLDQGAGLGSQAARPMGDGSGGWGLYLVDRIADRWAATPTDSGNCVWFELRCARPTGEQANGAPQSAGGSDPSRRRSDDRAVRAGRRSSSGEVFRVAYVYLLRCADDNLYCGWTTDVDRRLAEHRAGTASRYTRSRLPVELAFVTPVADRPAALREEARVKRLPRAAKLALIASIRGVDHGPRRRRGYGV